jgi:hypothetical protein
MKNTTKEALKNIKLSDGEKEFCNTVRDKNRLNRRPTKPKFKVETKFNGSVYLKKKRLLESEG